eukprot:3741191-Amphidinium_carterae.2
MRAVPLPSGAQLDNTMQTKRTPETPSIPTISQRLQLTKENFAIDNPKKTDAYYEKKILQETLRQSYVQFHPTTGYHKATNEIRDFYDGFELYNWEDENNTARPIDPTSPTMQQLMTISYHYANKFFDNMKLQDL